MSNIKESTRNIQVITFEVKAFSEEHARRIASIVSGGTMEDVLEVKQLTKGRQATTCRTDDFPTKGTRKWQIFYQVYAYGTKIPISSTEWEYLNMELVQDDIETKVEALKLAKDMAIKHQLPMTVQMVQKCVSHSLSCSDVEPKSAEAKFEVTVRKI